MMATVKEFYDFVEEFYSGEFKGVRNEKRTRGSLGVFYEDAVKDFGVKDSMRVEFEFETGVEERVYGVDVFHELVVSTETHVVLLRVVDDFAFPFFLAWANR